MSLIRWSDILNFDKLISTRIIRMVYLVGLGAIALYVLIEATGAFSRMRYDASGGLGRLMFTLALGAGGLLGWRVACEVIILGFDMHDKLTEIRDNTRRPS